MKTLLLIMAILLFSVTAYAEEMVTVPRQALIEIRDYIIELQNAYNALIDELSAKDEEISVLYEKIENYKRRASGVWLGASAGIPFPSASIQGGYIINNNIGLFLNGGYFSKPYIQAGVMVRVGK